MTDPRFQSEKWHDKNGDEFDVTRATEDISGVYVDGGRRDVSKGETLVDAGPVGFWSFPEAFFRDNLGCVPDSETVATPATDTSPAADSSTPTPAPDAGTAADPAAA